MAFSYAALSVLSPGFFMLSGTWLFLERFLLTRESFHSLSRISHRCSLYQQSSSWCLVSESLKTLLVSFHLGEYRSDKQITFQNSQKTLFVIASLSLPVQELVFILMFSSPGMNIYKGTIHCKKKQ